MRVALVMTIVGALFLQPAAREPYRPARYLSGGLPALAPMAVGGGEVVLELTVAAGGQV